MPANVEFYRRLALVGMMPRALRSKMSMDGLTKDRIGVYMEQIFGTSDLDDLEGRDLHDLKLLIKQGQFTGNSTIVQDTKMIAETVDLSDIQSVTDRRFCRYFIMIKNGIPFDSVHHAMRVRDQVHPKQVEIFVRYAVSNGIYEPGANSEQDSLSSAALKGLFVKKVARPPLRVLTRPGVKPPQISPLYLGRNWPEELSDLPKDILADKNGHLELYDDIFAGLFGDVADLDGKAWNTWAGVQAVLQCFRRYFTQMGSERLWLLSKASETLDVLAKRIGDVAYMHSAIHGSNGLGKLACLLARDVSSLRGRKPVVVPVGIASTGGYEIRFLVARAGNRVTITSSGGKGSEYHMATVHGSKGRLMTCMNLVGVRRDVLASPAFWFMLLSLNHGGQLCTVAHLYEAVLPLLLRRGLLECTVCTEGIPMRTPSRSKVSPVKQVLTLVKLLLASTLSSSLQVKQVVHAMRLASAERSVSIMRGRILSVHERTLAVLGARRLAASTERGLLLGYVNESEVTRAMQVCTRLAAASKEPVCFRSVEQLSDAFNGCELDLHGSVCMRLLDQEEDDLRTPFLTDTDSAPAGISNSDYVGGSIVKALAGARMELEQVWCCWDVKTEEGDIFDCVVCTLVERLVLEKLPLPTSSASLAWSESKVDVVAVLRYLHDLSVSYLVCATRIRRDYAMRCIVTAGLYAFADLAARCPLSSLSPRLRSTSGLRSWDGSTFPDMTACCALNSTQAELRDSISSYFNGGSLWDWSAIGGAYLSPDVTLKLICGDQGSLLEQVDRLCGPFPDCLEARYLRDLSLIAVAALEVPSEKKDEPVPLRKSLVPRWSCVGSALENGRSEVSVRVSMLGRNLGEDTASRRRRIRSQALPSIPGLPIHLSEDNILNVPAASLAQIFGTGLSVHEGEHLLSILSAPLLRIPLVCSFFAEDRAAMLFDPRIQSILTGVLFESGPWISKGAEMDLRAPSIPMATAELQRKLASSSRGSLASFVRTPLAPTVLDPLMQVLRSLIELIRPGGGERSTPALSAVTCFALRLAVNLQGFVRNVEPWHSKLRDFVESSLRPSILAQAQRSTESQRAERWAHVAFSYQHSEVTSQCLSHILSAAVVVRAFSTADSWAQVTCMNLLRSHHDLLVTWIDTGDSRIALDTAVAGVLGERHSEPRWVRRGSIVEDGAGVALSLVTGDVTVHGRTLEHLPAGIAENMLIPDLLGLGEDNPKTLLCVRLHNGRFRVSRDNGVWEVGLEQPCLASKAEVPEFRGNDISSLPVGLPSWIVENANSICVEGSVYRWSLNDSSIGTVHLEAHVRSDRASVFVWLKFHLSVFRVELGIEQGVAHAHLTSDDPVVAKSLLDVIPPRQLFAKRLLAEGGFSEYIPGPLLRGLVPDVFVSHMHFWRNKGCASLIGRMRPGFFPTNLEVTLDQYGVMRRGAADAREPMYLVSARTAERHTSLSGVLSVFQGSDHAGGILVWVRNDKFARIELARAGLSFVPSLSIFDTLRFDCEEQSGWALLQNASHYIDPRIIVGLPHGLVLQHEDGSTCVLVPRYAIMSAQAGLVPAFTRCFRYMVSPAGTCLLAPSLEAGIYLCACRLLGHDYESACLVARSCIADSQLQPEEEWALEQVAAVSGDLSPDAQAARVTLFVNALAPTLSETGAGDVPWKIAEDIAGMITKLGCVSKTCRPDRDTEIEALNYFLERGSPSIKDLWCSITLPLAKPVGLTSALCMARRSHLIAARSEGGISPREKNPVPLPHHGAGGLRRMEQQLARSLEEIEETMADYPPLGEKLPYMQKNAMSEEQITTLLTSLHEQSLLSSFLLLYDLIAGITQVTIGGVSDPSFGPIVARGLFAAHYLRDRKLQGTPLFPKAPYNILVGVFQLESIPVFQAGDAKDGAVDIVLPGSAGEQWLRQVLDFLTAYVGSDSHKVLAAPAHVSETVGAAFPLPRPILEVHDVGKDSGCSRVLITSQPEFCAASDLRAFASQPLLPAFADMKVDSTDSTAVRDEDGTVSVAELGFDISGHSAAQTHSGREMLRRLENDVTMHKTSGQDSDSPMFVGLDPVQVSMCARESLERDKRLADKEVACINSLANASGTGPARTLSVMAGSASQVTLNHIIAATVSSEGQIDLLSLNPCIEDPQGLIERCCLLMLRLNRIAQYGVLISLCGDILAYGDNTEQRKQSLARLALRMCARRYYVEAVQTREDGAETYSLDPRFLLFELQTCFVLTRRQVELARAFYTTGLQGAGGREASSVQQMMMGDGKTTVITPLLALLLADGKRLVTEVMPANLIPMALGIARGMFSAILPRPVRTFSFGRYSLHGTDITGDSLPARQIYAMFQMLARRRGILICSSSSVKSLILKFVELKGEKNHSDAADALAGALELWRNGVALLDEVDLLLHPLKSELNFPIGKRRTLDGAPTRWRVIMMLVDALGLDSGLQRALQDCVQHCAVQTSPHLILLSRKDYYMYLAPLLAESAVAWIAEQGALETGLSPVRLPPSAARASSCKDDSHGASCCLEDSDGFWCSGTEPGEAELTLDVPPGIELAAVRVEFEAVSQFLAYSGQSMIPERLSFKSGDGKLDGTALLVVTHPQASTLHTFPIRASTGRLVLQMKGVARWFAVRSITLYTQPPLHGISSNAIVEYLHAAVLKESNPHSYWMHRLPETTQQMINICRDCITSFMPHCISKINRVGYGLIRNQNEQGGGGRSRMLLAVPFIGKDAPSPAAEFAHPDVLITLTYLAYVYEGMRLTDVKSLVGNLKVALMQQPGPMLSRPAQLLFESWTGSTASSRRTLPLSLVDPNDHFQQKELLHVLGKSRAAIRYYLDTIVFPHTMRHRTSKLSASAQDLGSGSVFGTRLGFSGTPSNLLPREMGECSFEPGSEAKIIRVLCNSRLVEVRPLSKDWSATRTLECVAKGGEFDALIDTGALITGFSNSAVAEFLLSAGIEDKEGCVYIDEGTRKPFVLKRNGSMEALATSGLSPSSRFTFYDHVSTTGVDIMQSPAAVAAITLGKDMTLRDYAQGAWRMRGLGKGQRLVLLAPPELLMKVGALFPNSYVSGRSVTGAQHVVGWLVVNSMLTERIQFMQLCRQNLSSVWRRPAYEALLLDSCQRLRVWPYKSSARGSRTEAKWLSDCISLFSEGMAFTVTVGVPVQRPFCDVLYEEVVENSSFITTQAQREVIAQVAALAAEGSEVSGSKPRNEDFRVCLPGRANLPSLLVQLLQRVLRVFPSFGTGGVNSSSDVSAVLDCEVVQEKEKEIEQQGPVSEQPTAWVQPSKPRPAKRWRLSEVQNICTGQQGAFFSALSLFRTQTWDHRLDSNTAEQVFCSHNHTPVTYDVSKARRLKNCITALLIVAQQGNFVSSLDPKHYLLALSLAEAESVYFQLRSHPESFPGLFLLRVADGSVLAGRSKDISLPKGCDILRGLMLVFDCQTHLRKLDLDITRRALRGIPSADRKLFVHSVIAGRRRDVRKVDECTPLGKVLGELS